MFESYNTKKFGEYIKKLRKALNLSQLDVEKMSGISIDAIRRLENGSVIPRYDTLVYLSLTYKKDLVREFNSFSNTNEIMELYHSIDRLIADYNEKKLTQLLANYQNCINTPYSIKLINNKLKKQISLMIEGIVLFYTEKKIDQAQKLFLQAMMISIRNFTLEDFNKYKYTLLEIRILMLIGMGLLAKRSSLISNQILNHCLSTLNTNFYASIDEKMLISKLMFNISYNYHIMDEHQKSLDMASNGIEYCNNHFISFALAGLLFRKGVAMYHLGFPEYSNLFKQSLALLEIQENSEMYQVFSDAILNMYKE